MTETAFPALTTAQKIAKSLTWDVGVEAALSGMGINVFPINSIVRVLTDRLWLEFQMGMDLGAISFVNAQHEKAFNNAYATLSIIASGYGIESPQFKEARKNAQKYLSVFSRYGATL